MKFDFIITIVLVAFLPIGIIILVALTMEKADSYYRGEQREEQTDIKSFAVNKSKLMENISINESKKSDFGILKYLFGPSRDEIWGKLSEELNGKFIKGKFSNNKSRVEIKHREWTITLDSYIVSAGTYGGYSVTRIRAPFISIDGFRFKISRKVIFSDKIGKLFGVKNKNMQVGFPEFDNHFTITGNNEQKIKQLIKNTKIIELITSQHNGYDLSIKRWIGTYFPEGVYELFWETSRIVDFERLRQLFRLFAEILDQLYHIGSASKDDPKINVI